MNVLNAIKKIALFSLVLVGTVACQCERKAPKAKDNLDQGERVIEKKELDMEKPSQECEQPSCEESCDPCQDECESCEKPCQEEPECCDPCECSDNEPEVEIDATEVENTTETAEAENNIENEVEVDDTSEEVAEVEIEPIEKEYISNGEKVETETNEESNSQESVL